MFHILRCYKIKMQPLVFAKPVRRQYMKVSEKMEILLKQVDHIPRDYSLIYRQEAKYIPSIIYHTLNCVTFVSLGALTHQWHQFKKDPASFLELPEFIEKPMYTVLLVVVAIIVVTLATRVRGRFPVRIYYNEKTKMYRPIFIGKIPFTKEYYEFPQESICHATESAVPWQNTLFCVPNGRKIILFDSKFKTYSDFYNMFKEGELVLRKE